MKWTLLERPAYREGMPRRRKRPRDVTQLAKAVVDAAASEEEPEEEPQQAQAGRKGGLKAGKARAKALSAKRREIAKKAAEARWSRRS